MDSLFTSLVAERDTSLPEGGEAVTTAADDDIVVVGAAHESASFRYESCSCC